MSKKISLVLSLFILITVHANQSYSSTVATVNGKAISTEELNQKYEELKRFSPVSNLSKKNVLEDLIKRELALQEASKQGLEKDPVVVEKIKTILYNALIEKSLSKELEKIDVTDKEAENYYKKNPEIRTSHIFIPVPPGASKEEENKALAKIKTIQSLLKGGKKSFAEIAQEHSMGMEAPLGGDVDYQTKDRLDPTYYEAALALGKPDKVSGVVRSSFGFHIIKLTGVRDWDKVDTGKIKRLVFEQKRQTAFDSYMNKLRSKSKVTVNSAMVK